MNISHGSIPLIVAPQPPPLSILHILLREVCDIGSNLTISYDLKSIVDIFGANLDKIKAKICTSKINTNIAKVIVEELLHCH